MKDQTDILEIVLDQLNDKCISEALKSLLDYSHEPGIKLEDITQLLNDLCQNY